MWSAYLSQAEHGNKWQVERGYFSFPHLKVEIMVLWYVFQETKGGMNLLKPTSTPRVPVVAIQFVSYVKTGIALIFFPLTFKYPDLYVCAFYFIFARPRVNLVLMKKTEKWGKWIFMPLTQFFACFIVTISTTNASISPAFATNTHERQWQGSNKSITSW